MTPFTLNIAMCFRVLFIPEQILLGDGTIGSAEEKCICRPSGYGCIIVLAIEYVQDWSYHSTVFTHEFGHVLGAMYHDDGLVERT